MGEDERGGRYDSWVTADGGMVDRVALGSAVLLGVVAAIMGVAAVFDGRWPAVVLWVVVLGASAYVFRSARRRIRGSS